LRIVDAIPDVVLSSPLVRARQTAEILIEAFDGKPSLQIVPALAPPGDRTELYSEIRKHEGAESVMLVGHEPSLGEIACEIISGTPGCYLTLKKGSACAIGITRMSPVPRLPALAHAPGNPAQARLNSGAMPPKATIGMKWAGRLLADAHRSRGCAARQQASFVCIHLKHNVLISAS
jgi:phosphohistidine phosphatase SixA